MTGMRNAARSIKVLKKQRRKKDAGAGSGLSSVVPAGRKDDGKDSHRESLRDRIHAAEASISSGIHAAEHEADIVGKMVGDAVQETLGFKWTESRLYDALTIQEVHKNDVVTFKSLLQALGVKEDQAPFIKYVIEQAQEGSQTEQEATCMSLSEQTRLLGRIDSNVQQFGRQHSQFIEEELAEGSMEKYLVTQEPSAESKTLSLAWRTRSMY